MYDGVLPAAGQRVLTRPTCAPTQRPTVAWNGLPAGVNCLPSRLYENFTIAPSPTSARKYTGSRPTGRNGSMRSLQVNAGSSHVDRTSRVTPSVCRKPSHAYREVVAVVRGPDLLGEWEYLHLRRGRRAPQHGGGR